MRLDLSHLRACFCWLILAGVLMSLPAKAESVSQAAQQNAPATPASSQSSLPDAAQPPATQPETANPSPGAQPAPAATQDSAAPQAASEKATQPTANDQDKSEVPGGMTEEEIKRILVGKPLFLRGGYLSDTLSYNEHGALIGHAQQASYTLCGIEIDKVRLTRHKVELEGARYGLHFLGALPYEDPTKAVDRVKITPKKKVLRITIDRELVIKPKKAKAPKDAQKTKEAKSGTASGQPETASGNSAETSDADQAKAEIAAAPAEERPADPNSVTTTTSPAHAATVLKQALDNVFASGIDERMIAAMPDFWKLYYQAAAAKTDYSPTDPAVMRQNTVDQKAKLLSNFEPASNQFAQDSGVAGMSLYHVVIGADGKPQEIAVARPIGFGLDENAVEAIRDAKFEPAMKDGKPVPVLLDLVVQFRIYSKRTAASAAAPGADGASGPALPGPYSAEHP